VLRRTFAGVLTAVAMALPVTALVSAPTAAAAEIQAKTILFDDRQAEQYSGQIDVAVTNWNSAVSNVQLRRANPGQAVQIRIVADPGWPRATLGPVGINGRTGTVWMGREAITAGHDITRIAAHELGHSLGLPDVKPGPCSSLMSGSAGGVGCTNAKPNTSEASRVQRTYAGTLKTQDTGTGAVIVDAAY
jgi:snapalysin